MNCNSIRNGHRCGGKIFSSYGELGCIWCGPCPAVVVEPKPSPVHSNAIAGREQDKEAMLDDYYSSMMVTDFLIKWHIGTRYWARLKHVWGVTSKRCRRHRRISE